MQVDISIKHEKIYDRVDIATAYIGAKSLKEETEYDRMRTLKADRALLAGFLDDATGNLVASIGNYLIGNVLTADATYFYLKLRSSLAAGIQLRLESYYVGYILWRWYMLLGLSEADTWRGNYQRECIEIENLLAKPDETIAGKIARPRKINPF